MADKIFVDGMFFSKPREGAPEFIRGAISIKLEDFRKWMKIHAPGKEWLNIDLKKSQAGKLYLELNTYSKTPAPQVHPPVEPVREVPKVEYPAEEINPDEIPF